MVHNRQAKITMYESVDIDTKIKLFVMLHTKKVFLKKSLETSKETVFKISSHSDDGGSHQY